MRLIFIYGLPAAGKLTVAQELSTLTGYKVFHNHLTVDLLLSVFDFGGPPFVDLREQIWLSVFSHASQNRMPGLIFTFNPERTVRPGFIEQSIDTVTRNGGTVDFVRLVCPLPELKRRIGDPSRLKFGKLTSLSLFEELHRSGEFDTSHMPTPRLIVDTSLKSPVEAAIEIRDALGLGE